MSIMCKHPGAVVYPSMLLYLDLKSNRIPNLILQDWTEPTRTSMLDVTSLEIRRQQKTRILFYLFLVRTVILQQHRLVHNRGRSRFTRSRQCFFFYRFSFFIFGSDNDGQLQSLFLYYIIKS